MLRPGRGSGGGLPTAYGNAGGGGGSMSGIGSGAAHDSYGDYGSSSSSMGGGYASGSSGLPPPNVYTSSHAKRRGFKGKYGSSSSSSSPFANVMSFITNNQWIVTLILSVLFFFTTVYYRIQYTSLYHKAYSRKDFPDGSVFAAVDFLQNDNARLQKDTAQLRRDFTEQRNKANNLERSNVNLERVKNNLEKQLEEQRVAMEEMNQQSKGRDVEEEERTKKREAAVQARVDMLKKHISRESKRAAQDKFGPGPHRVNITVKLPDETSPQNNNNNSNNKDNNKKYNNESFVIELAPLDHMPHAVHLFLEQVDHQLWDGCSFVVNADHIIQAGPFHHTHDEIDKLSPFEEAKLDVVSFQEFHQDHPHIKYSVGFAGRPGGPDFYINKMNNTELHGPGGQAHHDLHEEADPCFGMVVDGFDVVEKMLKLPIDMDRDYELKEPVPIVSAKVVVSGAGAGAGAGNNDDKEQKKEYQRPRKVSEMKLDNIPTA